MSTSFYLTCDEHKERCEAFSRSAGGTFPLDQAPYLWAFVAKHRDCDLRATDEHGESEYRKYVGDDLAASKMKITCNAHDDLLAACEALTQSIAIWNDGYVGIGEVAVAIDGALTRGYAAIAKAKGQP